MNRVKIKKNILLAHNWGELRRWEYDYLTDKGEWQTQVRETYDRAHGMAVLLYNPKSKKIILTRQFRFPTYIAGNSDGLLIEVCAGKLEEENPEVGMIREIEEETGYRLNKVTKVFETYMSPGSVTELLHFFVGVYEESMKVSKGGGLESEQENIEVLEYDFAEALQMMARGEIKDAKTIMLLQHAVLAQLIS